MDRATLEDLLQEAESLLQRGELSIAFQREVIAKLERGGHNVTAAKLFLRRLEGQQARHIADRNRLFQQLTGKPSEPPTGRPSNRGKSVP
jgi:hypothetical protein